MCPGEVPERGAATAGLSGQGQQGDPRVTRFADTAKAPVRSRSLPEEADELICEPVTRSCSPAVDFATASEPLSAFRSASPPRSKSPTAKAAAEAQRRKSLLKKQARA